MCRIALLCVLLALSACAGGGRLNYGPGRTDYARPGPRGDPWRPYIREAANRFGVPGRWIRAVMRQESGGHEYRHGRPIVSAAGAMGLMQLMPQTYAEMQARYGLGDDPYQPHDNIAAGTAYIRLMYDRYGAPAFLAAYDAGPQRLDDYLSGRRRRLPRETRDYVAAISPNLGAAAMFDGPSGRRATRVATAWVAAPMRRVSYRRPLRRRATGCVQDPDAAYDPMSPCAPAPPQPQSRPAPPQPQSRPARPQPQSRPAPIRAAETTASYGAWSIQVGAYATSAQAHFADTMARAAAMSPLAASRSLVEPTSRFGGAVLYRARLEGLARADAGAACTMLARHGLACMIVAPGG